MILSLIVAIAEDSAMGKDNRLPWHLPADLKFFKRVTMGKPVIMGRRTFESVGRPLPGRLNIVLSSGRPELPEGVLLYDGLDAAIERIAQEAAEEAFIIGGSRVFADAMPRLQRMYITRIRTTVPDADTFFPHVDHSQWKLVWTEDHAADEQHAYPFQFQQWERLSL
jgi:dihydrofolate reductase